MSAAAIVHPADTRSDALRRLASTFVAEGVPEGDARFLMLGVLDLRAIDLALHGQRVLGPGEANRLEVAAQRRLSGEPVARILGAWEFWGLPFRLSPETLVPRPDTETLVEAALASIPDHAAPVRILDLGTGSGCILVALLSALPNATGIGLDRSWGALRTARANARDNGVAERAGFIAGDWCDALGAPFDRVVSNPPYIASPVIAGLDREVREHDPLAALDGGDDGLGAYRRIVGAVSRGLLATGGSLHLEIGYDQAEAVTDLGAATGLRPGGIMRDLAGHARVASFTSTAAAVSA
ncbi:Release factor glutamine methyltransferase [Methylobacterium cerastii]|uniref:Release factor glutamine methyltransferase n=1 Tax=Methylobacterium cerastii TaxID=932741 RepID=A0ABQ4QES5_9HYPH|nr:peptide chain release factor N(5)-glutamine methyltransferase [Methylobacterium cerastii]GJD43718.1 Release factor glutamine methyltransferase [Methylobacterium cerastii]